MKLKQALIIGLSGAILAIPAFAAIQAQATDPTSVNAEQQVLANPTGHSKDCLTHHKNCLTHKKKCLTQDALDAKQHAQEKLNELNTLDSATPVKN
jgi:predicted transglutaminase-like cysteine proteinase